MKKYFTTVVGGRPSHQRNDTDVPRGWEVLLKKAKVDPEFGESLLDDPVSAAKDIGLDLSFGETEMIRNLKPSLLAQLVEKTTVPPKHTGIFRFGSTAAMLALVMAASAVNPVETAAAGGEEEIEVYPTAAEVFGNLEFSGDTIEGQLGIMQTALEVYHSVHGQYPTTAEWYRGQNEIYWIIEEYCSNCDFLEDYLPHRYVGVWWRERVTGYRLESNDGRVTAPIKMDTHRFPDDKPLIVIRPEEGSTIPLSPNRQSVTVKFVAEHNQKDAEVAWYTYDSIYPYQMYLRDTTSRRHTVRLIFVPGTHRVLAVDKKGYGVLVTFTVEEE